MNTCFPEQVFAFNGVTAKLQVYGLTEDEEKETAIRQVRNASAA